MMWCKVVVTLVLLSVYMCSLLTDATEDRWRSPGCHLVGYVDVASWPGCHEVLFRMNACRGFCMSYSYLPPFGGNRDQLYETRGTCCSIRTTHDVIVILPCENNQQQTLTYKSAASCGCSVCSDES